MNTILYFCMHYFKKKGKMFADRRQKNGRKFYFKKNGEMHTVHSQM